MVKVKRRQWTQREIKKAIKMYHDGIDMSEIGRQLNRGNASVRVKLQALGIHEKDTFRKMANTVYLYDIEGVRGNLINVNEAKQTTAQSHKKLLFKCSTPNCDNTKMMAVHKLVNQGFACNICSTGTSYPELFFLAVNQHFNLGYSYQETYRDGRFDFINHDTKVVVEMNGIAHYEDNGYMNHKATVESDNKKRKWCKANGYNLIFIDARKSTFEFIQDNINECELLPTITESDIEPILEITEQNKKYPVKEICDMYLLARKTTVEIAEHYSLSYTCINGILTRNNVELRGKALQGKKVRCVETGIIYSSTMDAGRQLGVNQSSISTVCNGNGKQHSAGGYTWEFLSESESNAHHRASLVSQQDKLDTIELDSSDHMLDLFNKNKEKV